jgi:hypothetical protein
MLDGGPTTMARLVSATFLKVPLFPLTAASNA